MQSFIGRSPKRIAKAFAALGLATSLIAFAGTAALASEDLKEGLDAYQARDFKAALKPLRKAAEDGSAEAQFRLAAMYFNGHGVDQDRDEAARWFREAAIHGNREAQYILGVIYWDGRGVAKDHVSAYMWFNIASSNGDKSAAASGSRIAASLSSPDISEAERRARVCLESDYRNCD